MKTKPPVKPIKPTTAPVKPLIVSPPAPPLGDWKGRKRKGWAGALGLAAPAKLKKTRGAAALA